MVIRDYTGLSVANPCSSGVIRVLSGQSGGRPWLWRGYSGATPWLKRGSSGFKMSRTAPDEIRTAPGGHTDYPDELRITRGLHPDDAGLTPDCNTPRIAPDVLNILKHPGPSPDHPGTPRTSQGSPRTSQGRATYLPRMNPDHPGQRRIHGPVWSGA